MYGRFFSMKIKSTIYTFSICIFLNITLQAQLGISHLKHDHKALLSLNYEPYDEYFPLLLRYGKVLNSNTFIGGNIGYSESPSNETITVNTILPQHLFTTGIELEHFLIRSLDKYPISISIFGRYQYELYDLNFGYESEHNFDLRLRAFYPYRYKKISISPYVSYGTSNFSTSKITLNHDIGGIIGFHWSESDYFYLFIYSQRYGKGIRANHRTFVSLGLLW